MARCAIRKGFFVLRDCLHPTEERCVTCNRHCCSTHSRVDPKDQMVIHCIECYAKQFGAADDSTQSAYADETDTGAWAYGYRSRYYHSSSYRPFYLGHRQDSYYDDYDVRAFDSEMSDDFETDDEGAGGFYDS